MTTSDQRGGPQGVHLVGSVPLENAEQVFRTANDILGSRLRRIPDGETGVRTNWIGWQAGVLMQHPLFERVPTDSEYSPLPHFRLRLPTPAEDIRFENLGYADAARASWASSSVIGRWWARLIARSRLRAPINSRACVVNCAAM